MKLKPKCLPFIALGAGIPALLFRIWLFATGVDAKGLVVAGHPANALSYIMVALGLLALLWTVYPYNEKIRGSRLFRPSIPACVGSGAAALGIVYTAVSEFVQNPGGIGVLSCVLGIFAAMGILLAGILRLKRRCQYLLHAVLTAYLILHILTQYRVWNSEPQLQNYFPQLLAAVFLMITAYYRTALDAGTGNLRSFLFFNYGAMLFSCISIKGEAPVFYLAMALWTATVDCSFRKPEPAPAPMILPEEVLYCLQTLKKGGHSAYVVGGCVRDHLLGMTPHDYDLCTSARPEEICALFEGHTLVRAGEKHGTIGVVIGDNVYEITTYRTEGAYTDNRHPDQVAFVSSIQEDLSRRDFTVNAMAYCPGCGYVDPFGGRQDLKDQVLRAVGDPETRFQEDALRILRGVRFAVRFRLEPEENTMQATLGCIHLTDSLARERIFAELCGLLPFVDAQDLIRYSPVLSYVIPELAPAVGFDQHSPYHTYDVYTHIAYTVASVPAEPTLRFAALLHDIGKPSCFAEDSEGNGHFYGHAKVSAQMADEILQRFRAPNALRERVVFLVENHMTLLEPDRKLLRRRIGKFGQEATLQLLALQKADLAATGKAPQDAMAVYEQKEELVRQICNEENCLHVKDLAVNGSDLIELGFRPGPEIGRCLEELLTAVMEETLPNEKEQLMRAARDYLQQ